MNTNTVVADMGKAKYIGRGGKRVGAGRPTASPTRVARVQADITNEELAAIPSLKIVLDHWEEECKANPDGARYHFLRQMIEEIRTLGI